MTTGDPGRPSASGNWRRAPAKPVLHRFTYPDGPHDAETLLLNGDGTPIIVTKDPFTAGLYVPAAAPGPRRPPRCAGRFVRIPGTSTSNPFGLPGRLVLTGGATAPDGTRVALRTYADAFEFAVTDGDVIAAVTTGKAVTTALPDEPQGESLAYSADGASLLTVSETGGAPAGTRPEIPRYASGLPAAEPRPPPRPPPRRPAPSRPQPWPHRGEPPPPPSSPRPASAWPARSSWPWSLSAWSAGTAADPLGALPVLLDLLRGCRPGRAPSSTRRSRAPDQRRPGIESDLAGGTDE